MSPPDGGFRELHGGGDHGVVGDQVQQLYPAMVYFPVSEYLFIYTFISGGDSPGGVS